MTKQAATALIPIVAGDVRLLRCIYAVICALLLSVQSAVGQDSPGPRFEAAPDERPLLAPPSENPDPRSEIPPSPIFQSGPSLAPAPAVPMAMPACWPEELWIASSRKCRQTAPHACACGDLEFHHLTAGNQPQPLNRDAFHASLAPGVPVCIVVHGSFNQWRGLCDECWPVYRWIRSAEPQRPLHVIFFTWPSDGGITYEPHIDVGILGVRASFNAVYLGDLIARIPPGHPLCVVGHSHGARMTAAALHLLSGGEVNNARLTYQLPPDQHLRSVLISAALDHHWFDPGQRFDLALYRTECMLVMRNDHDIVLSLYPLRRPFSRRALGEKGLDRRDLRRLGPLSEKVTVLDVTRQLGTGHMWTHYYHRPELASAIAPYVFYDDLASTPIASNPVAPQLSTALAE